MDALVAFAVFGVVIGLFFGYGAGLADARRSRR